LKRRTLIATTGAAVVSPKLVFGAKAERAKPQPGDILAHAFGDRAGIPIQPHEVADNHLFAFPLTIEGVLRSGSLHNQLIVVRLDETAMTAKTRQYATGPFVAVSASCTHTGCEISGWQPEYSELECPCHGSRFDLLNAARVINGPATKPLAYLPIEIKGDEFIVSGKFSRRVGPPPAY
jgi:Rieske Fe-S protein